LEKVLRKKAEADGLDPKTVDAAVSQRTSRRYLIAAAMKGCGNNDDDIKCNLSTKKLRDKTLPRWIAENNVMPALSNAATCIITHAIEGKRPLESGGPIDYDSLSDEVRETFDFARESLNADDVHFTHPS
jgi:Tfp pilus assembly protein PilV